MRFKIDLKIFLFLILFYFTKQIETYVMIIIFAIIHELGHLIAGLAMGMRPEKMELKPYGVSISFKLTPKDYNQKIIRGNLLEVKKIFVALAGPLTNLLIIFIAINIEVDLFSNLMIIYANLLLILFNLLPIYPLDGGRILKGILHIFFGKRNSEKYINTFSFLILILVTFIASIGVFYMENISIFLITIFLWMLYLKEDIVYRKKNKIYDLIEKTIEIETNK
ncbi:MAG: site-2 protease family protein [Clostridia bacterium]